jgi:hypothetical protein
MQDAVEHRRDQYVVAGEGPDYNGNSIFNTLGNIQVNPNAGLLFIDFESGRTLQISGVAPIDWDPTRTGSFLGAERVFDFRAEDIIDNNSAFL